MKTLKEINKRFEKLLRTFNEDMREADLMFDEEGWTAKIESFYAKEIEEILAEITLDLYRIKANISLTFGKKNRKEIEVLVDKLQVITKRK